MQNDNGLPGNGPAPVVTIVTPAFRAAQWIEGALESVAAQRAGGALRVLHVIADGGPDDGTAAIVARHDHPDTTYVRRPDSGPADAINRAFAEAPPECEFLAWLNADDLYASDAIARGVQTLRRHPEAAFAFGRCPVVDASGAETRRFVTAFKNAWQRVSCHAAIRSLNYVCQPATLIRRSAWREAGPLRTDLKAAWDYDLWLRLWRRGGAARIPGRNPVAFFRWTPGSISGSAWRRQFAEELAIARADAGRFAPTSLLHAAVARGICLCYSRMNRQPAPVQPTVASTARSAPVSSRQERR